MNILKALFGNADIDPEEEKKQKEEREWEALKFDGARALKTGQLEIALSCLQEALQRRDDLETRDYLARTLLRMGRLTEAMEHYQRLIEAEPENTELLLQMAHVCYMEEDYAQMAQWAQRAIDIDGQLATAHYMLAQASIGQGDKVSGIARLTQAIAIDDNLADARLLRGQTLLAMGDVQGAASDADELLNVVPEQEDVFGRSRQRI